MLCCVVFVCFCVVMLRCVALCGSVLCYVVIIVCENIISPWTYTNPLYAILSWNIVRINECLSAIEMHSTF